MLNDLLIRSAGLGLLQRFPDQPFPHKLTPEVIDGICRSIYLRNGLFYLHAFEVKSLPVMSNFYGILDSIEDDELVFGTIMMVFERYEFATVEYDFWYKRIKQRYLNLWLGKDRKKLAQLPQQLYPWNFSRGKTYSNGTVLNTGELIPFALELREAGYDE